MTTEEIVRAWKDPQYRSRLALPDLARLPAHPSGSVQEMIAVLDDSDPPPFTYPQICTAHCSVEQCPSDVSVCMPGCC